MPVIDCQVRAYFGAFIIPVAVTFFGIGCFLTLKHFVLLGEWAQLGIGGALAILGIATSAVLQRQILMKELAEIEFANP